LPVAIFNTLAAKITELYPDKDCSIANEEVLWCNCASISEFRTFYLNLNNPAEMSVV